MNEAVGEELGAAPRLLGREHESAALFMKAGGAVAGTRIHGSFPDDLTEDSPLNVRRGRLIPTTPWESVCIGRPASQDSYLNMAAILSAATITDSPKLSR